MAKIVALPAGQIIKGDFCGQYLYKWDNTSWGVCPGAKLENGWLNGNLYWHNDDYSQSGNWTGPKSADLVSESTVDHYEEIGSQTTGPDASAMLKGTLIGGIGLGVIAGAASTSATTNVAIYLKNGKSFVVCFSNTQCWLELKSMLHKLETPRNNTIAQPQQPSIASTDKFEAIKKYKELLDLDIITKEEFDKKKDELLGLSTSRESEEKTTNKEAIVSNSYNVIMASCGPNKTHVIMELRKRLNLDLASAKRITEAVPSLVASKVSKEEAESIKQALENYGASIQLLGTEA